METKDLLKFSNKLRKKYTSVYVAGTDNLEAEYISTGNLAVDLMLEGGIAWGYISEWSGKSGSGKSLMLQKMLADAQAKYNAIGIIFDRENAWHTQRMQELNIDPDRVIVVKPVDIPTVEDMKAVFVDLMTEFAKANKNKEGQEPDYIFIAVDSISSFDYAGDADMGRKAKALHEFFRKAIPYIDRYKSLNFANQRTFKIGVLFGNPETTTGGEGPKYYSSYRLKLDDKRAIIDSKKGNETVGNWIEAYIVKTRTGPSHRSVSFPFYYKEGIDYYGGYGRLLAKRGYLRPKNKAEFNKFAQSTLLYEPDEETKHEINEHRIEAFLEKYPQFKFDTYPEYYTEDAEDAEDAGEENVPNDDSQEERKESEEKD